MAKEICISSTPHETRLAILEDDQLAEIYYERENEYTLAGSIYNGRVTRVLPGMQSAFVDVGLERDAFLYVTDFLELEDQEEAEELEKAAASGGSLPPREVRPAGQALQTPRSDDRGQRPPQSQKPEQKQDRPPRDRRPAPQAPAEGGESAVSAPESLTVIEHEERALDEGADPGAKRWRGRRRRRGGRGPAGSPEGQNETEETAETLAEPVEETHAAPVIQAAAAPAFPIRSEVPPAAARFVLPGESLSKYGGTAADEAPKAAPEAPPRPASTYKPSTLIQKPIEWDGSGLLPGESLSKHRNRSPERVVEVEVAADELSAPAPSTENGENFEEEAFFAERLEPVSSDAAAEQAVEASSEEPVPVPAADYAVETAFEAPALDEPESPEAPDSPESVYELDSDSSAPVDAAEVEEAEVEAPAAAKAETPVPLAAEGGWAEEDSTPEGSQTEHGEGGPESDRNASHHVDPLPPSGFRLFGLGGKKKKSEESASPEPIVPGEMPPAKAVTTAVAVSSYAPGSGLIEEEVIEGEEFEAVPHHFHKADEHDLDDFEEETLQTQIRSGDVGEMLQEAHLDHKIELNLDGKSDDDDEGDDAFDEDEDEEEEAVAGNGAQPAATDGQAQQRRDRGGRGRRGRGGPGGPPGKGRSPSRRSAQTSDLPIISDLLKPGQEILVQIAKEPIAKKGARITSHIALPGRFLVFMPTVSHVGVSRKIASDEERQRLKRILVSERGEASGGFIVRTAAEGASEEELRADLRFLLHLWDEIKHRSENSKSPALIYHDLSLIERILRDQVSSNFSSIWVDSEADYERIVRFLNRFSPTLVRRVKLYTKDVPLFEHFGIQDEISKALRSKVWLKSGGSIVINQTEALVAIDINTGKYVGKSARLEDTILKTNLDAVPEIVRQVRLRDLGGIIVIDFIDMDERKNRFKVMAALEEALKSDRAPTKVLQFNDFGLVAITRKRVKQSLERTLSVPCPTCQATGMVKSPATVCNEIYTELRKMRKHFESADVMLRVNPETVKVLKANNASWLNEFEELVGKNILVKSDATLHPEQFDIQG
jgi:ribonuclease G